MSKVRTLAWVCVSLWALFALTATGAAAATFTVNNTTDATGTCPTPTTCSLRQAIGSANATAGDDTIDFSIPSGSTISLTNGALTVSPSTSTDKTAIAGPGANQLTIRQTTASTKVFVLGPAGSLTTISGVTITGGSTGPTTGAGINTSAPTNLDGVVVTGNSGNAGGSGSAGGIASFSALTISNSTISGNSVTNSGAGQSGGGIVGVGSLTIFNSTIAGNTVTGAGPNDGGGIMLPTGVGASVKIFNSTIAGNSVQGGAGGVQVSSSDAFVFANTIIAGNTGTSASPDCANTGTIASQGYNLIGNNGGCAFTAAAGDQVGTPVSPIDPMLAPLGGTGATPVRTPLAGSPAINAGNPAAVSDAAPPAAPALVPCRTMDQLDTPRPQQARCDIGAVEFVPPPPPPPVALGIRRIGVFPHRFALLGADDEPIAPTRRPEVVYSLTRAAVVKFRVQLIERGLFSHGRCHRTSSDEVEHGCKIYVDQRRFKLAGKAGLNKFRLTDHLGNLEPGTYRITATAFASGSKSAAKSCGFTILRHGEEAGSEANGGAASSSARSRGHSSASASGWS